MTLLSLLTAVKSGAPKLTHVIPSHGKGPVSAVTSLGNELFVLRWDWDWDNQQVEVYDASTFTLQRNITVPGLGRWPRGLAVCAHNKCLYVSDDDVHRAFTCGIHRAELSGSNAVKMWSLDSGPYGLSLNKEHNVVVVCCEAPKIQEYTTHGALVREISLEQAGMKCPWDAVQLSTGDYVVSENKSHGAVIVVGIDGRVVRRYCPSPFSNVGKMNLPSRLAVTKNDDILVTDTGNKRILLVKSSLSSARELALPADDGIRYHHGLCLDESRGRLYVGESGGSKRLLVFDGVQL